MDEKSVEIAKQSVAERPEIVRNDLQRWIVGSHIGFSGKISDTILATINHGMGACQFFMGSNKSFARTKITESDIEKSKGLLARFPISVFTHFPYIANLAGSSTEKLLAWTGSAVCDRKVENVLKNLEYELNTIAKLGIPKSGVVIHPGTFKNRVGGLKAISTSINKINFEENSQLLLENSAGQGASLATTLTELKTILDGVEKTKQKHVGICIDTCHLFAYGDYDISSSIIVENFFEDFDHILGLEKLKLIHLNDSLLPLKCKKDRHERIGCGKIWSESRDSLFKILEKCSKIGVPAVLETTTDDFPVLKLLESS